jgi:cell division protein FtsW
MFLAAGMTLLIGAQSFLIMAGVARLIPLTGVTLPFVSYGGSSLLMTSIMIGLLLNLSSRAPAPARRARRRR